jgi:hypothetical protein
VVGYTELLLEYEIKKAPTGGAEDPSRGMNQYGFLVITLRLEEMIVIAHVACFSFLCNAARGIQL